MEKRLPPVTDGTMYRAHHNAKSSFASYSPDDARRKLGRLAVRMSELNQMYFNKTGFQLAPPHFWQMMKVLELELMYGRPARRRIYKGRKRGSKNKPKPSVQVNGAEPGDGRPAVGEVAPG